jgi:hypothetical protein
MVGRRRARVCQHSSAVTGTLAAANYPRSSLTLLLLIRLLRVLMSHHSRRTCKATFSASSGTLATTQTGHGVWVKIMTAIEACGKYTLSFKTSHTTVNVPVLRG